MLEVITYVSRDPPMLEVLTYTARDETVGSFQKVLEVMASRVKAQYHMDLD
jgi:hypothetical protein